MFLLYIFVSENYVNYFLFSKPHLCNNNNNNEKKNNNTKNNIFYNSSNGESKSTIISLSLPKFDNNTN